MEDIHRMSRPPAAPRNRPRGPGLGALLAGVAAAGAMALASRRARPPAPGMPRHAPRRRIRQGAAILGGSVLADSAMEHFRGGFHRPAMYAAPAAGAVTVAASLAVPRGPVEARRLTAGHAAGIAFGAAGIGFHLFNIGRRPGGFNWDNLFYAAPIGAPGALIAAGLLNLFADELERTGARRRIGQRDAGRGLAALTAAMLVGDSAEVALLHFRGAFHNPAMYAPVTVPPLAAAALLDEAICPGRRRRASRALLMGTAALGAIGTGFHAFGIARMSGGWRNWRQNLMAGPPMPAPISFTGLALAGLAALDLIERSRGR